ncbi:kinesin-like protein [Ordospora colligata]|uniref:Kinesin-like protein n=1 Tax=Ordospora colligata OC4 TaxID=1354746 RepID=A0A0B2UK51_9MICR|nr:kinesin-like protein [Ordospora colligata OC4]KHN69619.1 kinesin-like protein [Ordospora colligata OC4]TBU15738.1 kinesin-like protein [Ordospora colligata]TBU15866.1 kinesin-like protein [Ordospora colligata]TBU18760.1 kinesin-like protein [Ordospora colligata]
MAGSSIPHRISELKAIFSDLKENIDEKMTQRPRKDSVLLEICAPGCCEHNGCIESTNNREIEINTNTRERNRKTCRIQNASEDGLLNPEHYLEAHEDMIREIQSLKDKIYRLEAINDELKKKDCEMNQIIEEYNNKIKKAEILENECLEQAKIVSRLRNEIINLKGSTRVLCRIKPSTGSSTGSRIEMTDRCLEIFAHEKKHKFEFDKIFGPDATQRNVYDEIAMMVQSVLDGYKICVFAYGQTGSGKTYTMEGDEEEHGLVHRAMIEIDNSIAMMRKEGWQCLNTCSYVEIYNEEIIDLFSSETKKISIVHDGGDTNLVNCTIMNVGKISSALKVLVDASKRRKVGSTECNIRSSRSHTVYILNVKMENTLINEKREGSMIFIDLAGSERLNSSKAEGARLKETQNINKSLSALGDVFNSILRKDSHIPFRNSKLTYLLQSFLSGNSRTVMFVTISPEMEHFNETICSLRFADKIAQCKLGVAQRKAIKTFMNENQK